MRLATSLAVLVLAASLLAGCGSSSEASSTGTSSPRGHLVGAPVRNCPLDVGGTRGLHTVGVSCGEAQRVVLAWRRDSSCAAAPGASHSACSVRGYRCIGTVTDRGLAVSCTHRGPSVAFTVPR